MEMTVVPTAPGSKHKYSCAGWCPLSGAEFESVLKIGDKVSGRLGVPKDLGSANVTQPPPAQGTALCERWMWKKGFDAPRHNWSLVMSQEDFFVAGTATPFLHKTTVEPFGRYMGEQNASYSEFTPMNASSHFDIDPESMKTCKPTSGCEQTLAHPADAALRAHRRIGGQSFLSLAHQRAETIQTTSDDEHKYTRSPTGRALSDRADLDMPLNYVSSETMTLRQSQNAQLLPSGETCCDLASPGCQVQLQHFDGVRYFDWLNQRQRVENGVTGETTVDDYMMGKAMLVVNVSGVETCKEYCPITLADDMTPLALPKKARHLGHQLHSGEVIDHWHWADTLFKFIPMAEYDVYTANRSAPAVANHTFCYDGNTTCAVPLTSTMAITPFGRRPAIGWHNKTWRSLKMEIPPAAKFHVAGADTCPESKSCGSQSWQLHRLGSHQLHTFFGYLREM